MTALLVLYSNFWQRLGMKMFHFSLNFIKCNDKWQLNSSPCQRNHKVVQGAWWTRSHVLTKREKLLSTYHCYIWRMLARVYRYPNFSIEAGNLNSYKKYLKFKIDNGVLNHQTTCLPTASQAAEHLIDRILIPNDNKCMFVFMLQSILTSITF